VLLPLIAEEHAKTTRSLLRPGHPHNLPTREVMLPNYSQTGESAEKKGLTPSDVSPFVSRCRREDLNLHGHG
jgi:hypothetical protein